ncbi:MULTISPECIES: hypothetical protein [Cyanophyceae]|uniref:hypothetical protein n=1 Tax=Cyanophyceae TaxID=3028117 RepID=UPI00168A24B3|nr:hypothetical protein [Trichocoleus sp. FACHB-69]MBD1931666.1 hypothetical protein [Trichocoleus sp. FACHB-69]
MSAIAHPFRVLLSQLVFSLFATALKHLRVRRAIASVFPYQQFHKPRSHPLPPC